MRETAEPETRLGPAPRRIADLEALRALVGAEVGVSGWLLITQDRIDTFADATRDHQWIHVDPARAAEGPYAATVAHGYLTLSLLPSFAAEIWTPAFGGARLNYGLERVRFPSPVPVGSRIRDRVAVESVEDVASGVRVALRHTVEIEGGARPACVATQITLITMPPAAG